MVKIDNKQQNIFASLVLNNLELLLNSVYYPCVLFDKFIYFYWTARSCNPLGEIEHGTREGDTFIFTSRVTYHCIIGFELVGRPSRYCQSNGQWSAALPSCKRKFVIYFCTKIHNLREINILKPFHNVCSSCMIAGTFSMFKYYKTWTRMQ